MNDTLHAISVLIGPVEAKRRSPIVEYENDVFRATELFRESKKKLSVLQIGVTVRPRLGQLVSVTHSDQVSSYEAAEPSQ